jgi:hypothetical protein
VGSSKRHEPEALIAVGVAELAGAFKVLPSEVELRREGVNDSPLRTSTSFAWRSRRKAASAMGVVG